MLDRFDRNINYLRISVTDRCNQRCTYCMPAEGVKLMDHKDILSFEEITGFVKLAVSWGINKVRLTGGEPLVRKDIVKLVGMLADIEGIEDLSMTTNGMLLDQFAAGLKVAGLIRINVSVDTLNPKRYREITRVGDINNVFRGIEAAQKAGLSPIKINCVLLGQSNEEIRKLKKFCEVNQLDLCFIRQMNLQTGKFARVEGCESGDCRMCNKVRLLANGDVKPCLYSDLAYNIRTLGYEKALNLAIDHKPKGFSPQAIVPEPNDLIEFSEYCKFPPPLDKDFDIRKVETTYYNKTQPFRYRFYSISLYLEGNSTLNAGFWEKKLKVPALFVRSPYQILSWEIPSSMLREYIVVCTEDFLIQYKLIGQIILNCPIFKFDNSVLFTIDQDSADMLRGLYERIYEEYHSGNEDRYDLIISYFHTLLLQVQRLYNKFAAINKDIITIQNKEDINTVEQFKSLLKKHIATGEDNKQSRSVSFYAGHLSIHPNHLNAVVKRITGQTAHSFIHQQVINIAKALLTQTTLSMKEISYKLSFISLSHFSNFFKKYTGFTPVEFREKNYPVE